MASPMFEGHVDPLKKAHFTLHISDAVADGEVGDYTSVKYNHKPAQTTSKRTTTLTSTSPNNYRLTLEDDKPGDNKDVFIFTGQKVEPKKTYVLFFDTASQKATLEPLASIYSFNIASKNGVDLSSTHPKIWPRKQRDDPIDDAAADDLFGEDPTDTGDGAPDPNNPFDFRHFLHTEKTKRGDESEYAFASSPDYRAGTGTGTGSATTTPQFPARKPLTATSKPKAIFQEAPKPKKRKEPEPSRPLQKKGPPKKQAPQPTVRLERRATETKPARKPAARPPSSKIKSAEIVHSSDESDADAEREPDKSLSRPARRSPPPPRRRDSPESDEDEDMEDVLEIQGQMPSKRDRPLHFLNSPANGPRSLASAASSMQGSPDPHAFASNKSRTKQQQDDGVIDFGDIGGGAGSEDEEDEVERDDDGDVESMHLGSPAQQTASGGGVPLEPEAEEEEDPLLKEMMEGLAGGDSSEESEEE